MASYFDQVNGLAPKVWYRFNETAGTPVNSGSLTTTGGFSNLLLNEQTDVDGRAIYFNGSSSVIQLNAWPDFSLFNDKSFTIETWFKLGTLDANDRTMYRFSGPAPVSNTLGISVLNTNSGYAGKIQLTIAGLGEQTADKTTISTNSYNDNEWHHVVVAVNTTSLKWYIDGNLETTKTLTTGTLNWDSYTSSLNLQRLIGSGRSNVSESLSTAKYKGWLDEFAIYGYELTAQNVLDNFNAGASVEFADAPGTATALFLDPTLITEAILTVDPMTASSASGDHYVSNYDVVPPLESYLESLTLDQYIKFTEYHSARNYALNQSSNQPAITFYGNADNVIDGGLQLSGVIKFVGSGTTGRIIMNQTAVNNELTDGNFVLGCWLKIPSISDSRNIINSYDTQNPPQGIRLDLNSAGQLQFQIENNQVHTITGTDVIDDDQWHFVVLKVSNDDYEIWVDDVQDAVGTFNGSYPGGMIELGFGSNNIGSRTGFINLSHFFIGSTSNVTTGILTNIYNYGQEEIHAKAVMNPAVAKFDSSYNDEVVSLNPTLDFRLNEGSGTNIVTDSVKALVANIQGTARTSGVATRNNRGINFTDLDTRYVGTYAAPSGTFSSANKQSISVFFKTNGVQDDWDRICSTGMESLNGLSIETSPSGRVLLWSWTDDFYLEIRTASGTVVNGQWHHVVGVKDGDNAYIYFDGKLAASDTMQFTLSDTVRAAIGGVGVVEYNSYDYSAARNTTIDEFAIFPTALSAQEAFELYQSISMEMDTTASASLPMPTFEVGTGPTILADPMTASAEQLDPSISAAFLEAFAEFLMPNFGATVVIDVNYGHSAFEADALFHDPQFNIGEINTADHMNASAEMLDPIIITPGNFRAPVLVAGDAEFVEPGIVTIKGAQVFAEPARASSALPLPPAYITLTDDNWYLRLLQGHADKKIEAIQANLGNLPNQSTTDVVKGGFLSFFDDVLLDITPTTGINSISSEIPAHYFDRPGSYRYDNNGNLLPLDTSKAVARASAPRAAITPTPMASVGYFDNQERRALRIENVEFVLPGTSINHSERPYNLEFSFKTTKANQIIAYGQWNSFLYYGRRIGVIGLFDGKIYLADDAYKVWSGTGSASLGDSRRNIAASAPHPKNFTNEYYVPHLLGRKRIDDGQWHHVVIQKGWTDNRTQIWIDGALDRQIGVLNPELGSGPNLIKGLDGTNSIRPYIIGFNSTDPNLYSDFQTSAWNFYPGRFIEERDLSLNYSAFSKWEPIKPEPMLATINLTDNTKAKGNRPRAIMLYWWETNPNGSLQHKTFDGEELYNLDTDTFAQLKTQYNDKEPVQKYYGWDIFPIDILGRYRSPLTKEEVIVSAGYRDPVTGAPRYLDIINDLDLSTIDAIFFRNYPDETAELDEFARDEIADTYFGLTERTLYENFVKSLRNALDTGINLYITNHTLAKDLGIIRDAEVVYDLIDQDTAQFNSYPQEQAPVPLPNVSYEVGGPSNFKGWYDTYKNNYLKVINTVPGITDQYGIIRNAIQMYNPSSEEWNQPFRSFASYTQKQNLNVGDTFVISYAPYTPFSGLGNTSRMSIEGYYATHKDNVLAGIPITAFADTYRKNSVETENPYKDYVTSIALPTGTILNGRPIKSRVFVNFTERINGSFEEGSVELIQDEWIDLALQVGRITEAQRDTLKAASYNLDRRLEAAIAAGNQTQINQIQKEKYWDMNGMNMGSTSQLVQGTISDQSASTGGGSGTTATAVTSNRGTIAPQPDNADARASWGGGVWFKFQFFWQYPMLRIPVSSMLTRGFVWLANRVIDDGTVVRTNANTVSAEIVMPLVVADNDRIVYAQTALANANILNAEGYALQDAELSTLPFSANVSFGQFVKNITPDVMAAEARFRSDILTTAVETDQVVVYVYHVDPIVYLREEVIK